MNYGMWIHSPLGELSFGYVLYDDRLITPKHSMLTLTTKWTTRMGFLQIFYGHRAHV